ncbi:MAG: hypothetical protein IJE61_02720 [Bacteroidales bacterium]|nr:hypothetical protein [Bacteroidales bacterium]
MKKSVLILLTLILTLPAFAEVKVQKASDAPVKEHLQNHFKFYGFIRNYFAFDSRESVSGTGDLFYYLPKDENIKDGIDVNATPSFRFLALTSRAGVDVSGYYIGNVHFGAKIEADFYAGLSNSSNANAGTYFPSNAKISGTAQMRLRQAFATITWKDLPMGQNDKASVGLKIGQAWHPMAADHPHLFSLEVGAPFGPFSRTPLVQMDANLGNNWVVSAAAIWQMQYQSTGPVGGSALYMKYGMTPEVYAAVAFKSDGFLLRAGADMVSIKPRVLGNLDGKVVKVSDRKTSVLGYVYTQYTYKKFAVKAKTTFGEGGEHMNLMSGYAKVGENEDGSWNYASMRNSSSWLSLSYGKKWQGVLFLGYVKNLGLAKAASGPLAKEDDVYFCGNGFSNINQMYRINPQVIYNIGKLNVGLEYQWTSVQYGKYDDGKLNAHALADKDLHWIGNHRVNMMVKYNF